MFLTVTVVGLVGLVVMALPALGRFGGHGGHGSHVGPFAHSGHTGPLGALHPAGASKGAATQAGLALTQAAEVGSAGAAPGLDGTSRILRLVPSPRAVCSLLALYGAFGNLAVAAFHLAVPWAALAAAVPALVIERYGVTPLWNWLFGFQGQPTTSLETLALSDAEAVSAFRNGRGIVSVLHDGRRVQLSARLAEGQTTTTVRVGDRLQIEDVDAANERVTVSIPRD